MTSVLTEALPTLDDDALDLIFREARTANTFTDDPVSREQLEGIYELTKFGPTAANTQPLRIVFLTGDEAKERLLPHMSEGNRAKTSSAPVVAILAADTDFHEQMHRTFPHNPGARANFAANDAAREQAARFNAAIQIGYFIVAARSVGLAAGPMAGFDHAAVDTEFFTGTPLQSLLVVNLGHPGENAWFDRLPRLKLDEAVTIL